MVNRMTAPSYSEHPCIQNNYENLFMIMLEIFLDLL